MDHRTARPHSLMTADAAVSTHDGDTWIAEPDAAQAMLHLAQELYPGLRDSNIEASGVGGGAHPRDRVPRVGRWARPPSTGFPCSDEAPPSRTSISPSPTAA
jgi:glycine/D-amino acid oxidase-like deaminating enzyme